MVPFSWLSPLPPVVSPHLFEVVKVLEQPPAAASRRSPRHIVKDFFVVIFFLALTSRIFENLDGCSCMCNLAIGFDLDFLDLIQKHTDYAETQRGTQSFLKADAASGSTGDRNDEMLKMSV